MVKQKPRKLDSNNKFESLLEEITGMDNFKV